MPPTSFSPFTTCGSGLLGLTCWTWSLKSHPAGRRVCACRARERLYPPMASPASSSSSVRAGVSPGWRVRNLPDSRQSFGYRGIGCIGDRGGPARRAKSLASGARLPPYHAGGTFSKTPVRQKTLPRHGIERIGKSLCRRSGIAMGEEERPTPPQSVALPASRHSDSSGR